MYSLLPLSLSSTQSPFWRVSLPGAASRLREKCHESHTEHAPLGRALQITRTRKTHTHPSLPLSLSYRDSTYGHGHTNDIRWWLCIPHCYRQCLPRRTLASGCPSTLITCLTKDWEWSSWGLYWCGVGGHSSRRRSWKACCPKSGMLPPKCQTNSRMIMYLNTLSSLIQTIFLFSFESEKCVVCSD